MSPKVNRLPVQEVFLSGDSSKAVGKIADVYFYFQDGKLFQVALTEKDCEKHRLAVW